MNEPRSLKDQDELINKIVDKAIDLLKKECKVICDFTPIEDQKNEGVKDQIITYKYFGGMPWMP